ncbi:MAG: hypothetical protein MHM6MM_009461, partial [Cercozoa sp. M6MM]
DGAVCAGDGDVGGRRVRPRGERARGDGRAACTGRPRGRRRAAHGAGGGAAGGGSARRAHRGAGRLRGGLFGPTRDETRAGAAGGPRASGDTAAGSDGTPRRQSAWPRQEQGCRRQCQQGGRTGQSADCGGLYVRGTSVDACGDHLASCARGRCCLGARVGQEE